MWVACIAKATYFFCSKNIKVFENTLATTVVINEPVKLMMLWTTGPRSPKFIRLSKTSHENKILSQKGVEPRLDLHIICFHGFISIFIWSYDFHVNITKTCLQNSDPLKPHFYIVKLEFTGVYIIFLISAHKQRLWVLIRTTSLRWF